MNRFISLVTTLSVVTSSLIATNLDKSDALIYLNELRNSAGLSSLSQNLILETAAQNHVNYLNDTGLTGHYENNSSYPSEFYTGNAPHDRGVYAGYRGSYYLENFSSGQDGVEESIDGLMSAIYHRFAFLDNNIDEIGIGLNSNLLFNYNMANSLTDSLCYGESYSGDEKYYFSVCSDSDFKIESTLYEKNLNYLADSSPDIVIWPPKNATDISPVFYEESPDPLPNRSVSGYPVSIEFNSYRYRDNNISIESFELYDAESEELITNSFVMDAVNDPNDKHNSYQFTFFPLERLAWNNIYRVEVNYSVDSSLYSKIWSFRTKNIPYPLYTLGSEEQNLTIKSDTAYAIYFQPQNENDTFNGTSYKYNTEEVPTVEIYDSNTLLVKIRGDENRYCNVELKKDGVVTKRLFLKIGENNLKAMEDIELENLFFTTGYGTTFETNIVGSLYDDKNSILTTAKVKTQESEAVFVVLSEESRDSVEVRLNIDSAVYKLPLFGSKSHISVQKIDENIVVEVKTKLTKSITFEGR
ncbi:MAG: CAP domain-containing protein [Campylobacterota bacterium]|nr:CAP domain-containing protein [Campylobacterota bacterium]